MKPEQITGTLVTRNWVANLVGQILPLLVGLVTIPYLIRHLGVERFGILSISWALFGYFGQLDMGLGRATTKYVAACLGCGDTQKLPELVWTSLFSQMATGLVGTLFLVAMTPILVNRVFKLPPAFSSETKNVLLILAFSLPLVIALNCLRGVLEAGQQFTTVNLISTPASVSAFLLPAIAAGFGIGLDGIVLLLVLARCIAALAYLRCCLKFLPILGERIGFDRTVLRPLFVFGGWVTLANLISPLLIYIDRFFIGAIISMAAVGYYSVPYEIVTKLWLVPASLLATVFPAFTALHANGAQERLEELYFRSVKFILIITGSAVVLLAAFSRKILTFWLGAQFAAHSSSVLQILSLAILINCLAAVPFGLLQGAGRPDLPPKFNLLEVPFYAAALWFLLSRIGLQGAAWAWAFRVTADTFLLYITVFKLKLVSIPAMKHVTLSRVIALLGALAGVLTLVSHIDLPIAVAIILSFVFFILFGYTVWSYVLDGKEKGLLVSAAMRVSGPLRRIK